MDSFAFIIHPIDPKRDVSRKYPLLGKVLTEGQINFFSTFFPPVYLSEIEGITSAATGRQIKGWFVACPYTPKRMMELPERTVYRKIIQTGRMAEELGAQILGIGRVHIRGGRRVRRFTGSDDQVSTPEPPVVLQSVEEIYIFVDWWPGRVLTLPFVNFKVKSARILGSDDDIVLERRGERLLLKNLPVRVPDPLTTTIVLERV